MSDHPTTPTQGRPRSGCQRWEAQRWLVDVAIRTDGIEWDQPRIGYTIRPIGVDASMDFNWVSQRVHKFADLTPVFAAAARRRERLAVEAEAVGRLITAREHFFIAALLWLSAEWSIFENNALLDELDAKKNECYAAWGRHAGHHVERVEIPFGNGYLPAWFHLPPGYDGRPVPAVLSCGGMDAPKELQVAMYGDKFLERGMAVLAIDGPGQGESPVHGVYVTESNWIDAGQAMVDYLAARPEIDAERMGAYGISFGSFWMSQVAATQPRLKGCAVAAVCHEPGSRTLFEEASPTFKARYMWMAGMDDEDEFDRMAARLDLRPLFPDMTVPWLAVAGEADELSPIDHTYKLAAICGAPSSLLVFQDERHAFSGAPATVLGPNWMSWICDWLYDRVNGEPATEEFVFVTSDGAQDSREHPRSGRLAQDAPPLHTMITTNDGLLTKSADATTARRRRT